MNTDYTFIILTFNEELNLPRLLNTISCLNARICILDSGSSDQTRNIAELYHADFRQHPFENHPRQWDAALQVFRIQTPWVICLDADQFPSPELIQQLRQFRNEDHLTIDGIYFNRRHYFRGKWIRHGGCYPQYQLKMIRSDRGWSDLSEVLDHRLQVAGKTIRWKHEALLESNEKENSIGFWTDKHNHYATILAESSAVQRPETNIRAFLTGVLKGEPNFHNALRQQLWHRLPLYIRPFLYFGYRFFIRMGFLDGKQGIIFHFLHAFWFRLLTDIKIDEKRKRRSNTGRRPSATAFLMRFFLWFCLFYSVNIAVIAFSTPGGLYAPFFRHHLDYITPWRNFLVSMASNVLEQLGYTVYTRANGLSVAQHAGFNIVYSCLGYGIMSSFSAFVISYPKQRQSKLPFLLFGLCLIQAGNILRLVLISLSQAPGQRYTIYHLDHHYLYNAIIYLLLAGIVYLWIRT